MEFINRSEVRPRVVFLSDYDVILTQYLVQGVDVWINTPRRPWEASGTSGMKVLVNGGLNLSELDGWWAEAYCPEVGWALGDRKEHGNDPEWDQQEANALYDLLEKSIIPQFYDRDVRDIPVRWIGKIQESMARLTPKFSTNRVVREYTEKFYLPAAEQTHLWTEKNGEKAKEFVARNHTLAQNWGQLRFDEVKVENGIWEVAVQLGDLNPKDIEVQLYSEAAVYKMERRTVRDGLNIYTVNAPKDVPTSHLTPRVIPAHSTLLESSLILWQK
jgi:starch phosphorylase